MQSTVSHELCKNINEILERYRAIFAAFSFYNDGLQ